MISHADVTDEYESNECLMRAGRWSLWIEKKGSTFWHQCSKGKEEQYGGEPAITLYAVSWTTQTRAANVKGAWRCKSCYKRPPESILSVFLLNNFDYIAEIKNNERPY